MRRRNGKERRREKHTLAENEKRGKERRTAKKRGYEWVREEQGGEEKRDKMR